MEKSEIFNYISSENNAKISFFTSENVNYKCVNILSNIEKVRIYKYNKKNIKLEFMAI